MSVLRYVALLLATLSLCGLAPSPVAPASTTLTFAQTGDQATSTLLDVLYAGNGRWRTCDGATCPQSDSDWGVDSATYALFLRWTVTHDVRIHSVMRELADAAPSYPTQCDGSNCTAWSDTPQWDAVALMREYTVLGDPQILARAKAAFDYVEDSNFFALGACPMVPYQLPQPSEIHVKTLETEANAIKAAILLYRATHERPYLDMALAHYAAARAYFLDAQVPLYTVHVIDNGTQCVQVPHRFFASVNGDMIWNGIALWQLTNEHVFYDDALATARAVDDDLNDERGIFADAGGENDVVEPLVEAMYELAANEDVPFARAWLLRNATAALSARTQDGTFSRFFDGPAQQRTSVWQSNGGLALQIVAAAIAPSDAVVANDGWNRARNIGSEVTALPATITIEGSGVALVGSIARTCVSAHVRVLIDGTETFDQTGLWQNPSMHDGNSVFFAWRWSTPGTHTITLEPSNAIAPQADKAAPLDLQTYVLR